MSLFLLRLKVPLILPCLLLFPIPPPQSSEFVSIKSKVDALT
ncbi:hypothetical protein ACMBCN_02780 [Candidatus Liberibacter asiaticus]